MFDYNKCMTKKNITIEDLAKMVKEGFDKTATVEQVENLESWVKVKFDRVEKDLTFIKGQLADVVHRSDFEKLEGRVAYL